MSIQAKNIRNVVFAGHASKGKTTLCEALLNVAGTTERMGKTADSNTVLDFDSEEKKRKISVNSAVASFEYKGKNINLIDTPGLFDFAMGMSEGILLVQVLRSVLKRHLRVQVLTVCHAFL